MCRLSLYLPCRNNVSIRQSIRCWKCTKTSRSKIPTHQLNEIMLAEIEKYGPPAYRGEYIKIKYVTQLPASTPSFCLFCNHPDYVKEAYRNYLENGMREHFSLSSVPINIFFRKNNTIACAVLILCISFLYNVTKRHSTHAGYHTNRFHSKFFEQYPSYLILYELEDDFSAAQIFPFICCPNWNTR